MMWKLLSENSGTRAHSASHSGANSSRSALRQWECVELVERDRLARHRPDEPRARFDPPVIVHQADAGTWTAARCDCSLISRRPRGRAGGERLGEGSGRLRSLRSTR